MANGRAAKQDALNAVELGLNAVTFASERTSSTFGLAGIDQIDLYCFHDYTAATGVTIELDTTDQDGTPTEWFKTQAVAVSSGTGTASDFVFSKTTGADARFVCTFTGINARQGRLRINDTASGTTDTITVRAITKSGV